MLKGETPSNMNQTEQLIRCGMAYIDAINNLNEDHPENVSRILDILDCVHLDAGYHIGIYIEEICHEHHFTNQCEQSWFHCYQGKEEPIMRRPYDSWEWENDGNENMRFLRLTFEMFNHLTIDATPMGAWQFYLLCISRALLPFSGSLYYTKRQLIFTNDQLPEIWVECEDSIDDKLERVKYDGDLSPSIIAKGNEYIVSCCFWTKWGGLIRETVCLTFKENGKLTIGDFKHDTLYQYDCGVMY